MANVFATHSVGNSLMTYLRNAYPEPLRTSHAFEFRVISTGELAQGTDPHNCLTLLLFRITQDEHLRNRRRVNDASDAETPLSIDLHYLLTVWADNALAEHTVVSWAMRELQMHPVLDSSSLSADAEWDPSDVIQLIPAEITSDEMMRIWDLLQPKYRLSVSYIARVVRIDTDYEPGGRPVVASRLTFGEAVAP
jgi:Pvc16 N-terminal domain